MLRKWGVAIELCARPQNAREALNRMDLVEDGKTRKAEAYGDVVAPVLDAEDVATEIEQYVDAVRALVDKLEPLDEV